jgi:hypothetical protein
MRLNRENLTIVCCYSILLLISFVCFIGPWMPIQSAKTVNRPGDISRVAGINTGSGDVDAQLKVHPFSSSVPDSYIIPEKFQGAIAFSRSGIKISIPAAASFEPLVILTNEQSQLRTSSWLKIVAGNIAIPAGLQNTDLRVIVSFNNRNSWVTFNDGYWQEIDQAGAGINGINSDEFKQLKDSDWQAKGGFIPGVTETVNIGLIINPGGLTSINIPDFDLSAITL